MTTATQPTSSPTAAAIGASLAVWRGEAALAQLGKWQAELPPSEHPGRDLRWLSALHHGLGHFPIVLEAREGGEMSGLMPLALVSSPWFGKFLVSLPYVNSAGVLPEDCEMAPQLVERGVELARELRARYLELRMEQPVDHPSLGEKNCSKVHMRLCLPRTTAELLASFKSKLRSQIKAAQKHNFQFSWGGKEQLDDFYRVFSRNMRDLGTPVYPRQLFAAILEHFHGDAELCVARLGGEPAAAALLVHGQGVTEVPSASSLRRFNPTGVNMAMYWQLLARAVERGQQVFDFGRSTEGGGTYKFKEQWGAKPSPAIWQYCVLRGSSRAMRPDNGNFGLAIRAWQHLPLWLANAIGPTIVRGIP